MKNQQKRKYYFFRRIVRIFLGLALFLFLAVLFIRSPWGQNILVHKAVSYITSKTHTKVTLEKIFITFDGAIRVEHLFLEDKNRDTLLYSKSLKANIPLWEMIKGNTIDVNHINWEGLRANIIRKDTVAGYNFQFLMDAFTSPKNEDVVPETDVQSTNFFIGNIDFKNFDIVFNDAVLGVESSFKIGRLKANMKKMNLDKMVFSADEIALSDAKIKVVQTSNSPKGETSEGVLPIFSANKITFKNVNSFYQSTDKQLTVDSEIKNFYTEIPEINLEETIFRLRDVQLYDSDFTVTRSSNSKIENQKITNQENDIELIWPNITLEVNTIDLKNNSVGYFVDGAKIKENKINLNAIALKKINLKAADLFLKDKKTGIRIEEFNFKEKYGVQVHQFALNAKASDSSLEVSEIAMKVNKSNLTGYAKLNYSSLSQFIEAPENTKIEMNISSYKFWLADLFKLQPSLAKNEYLQKLSKQPFTGKLNAIGSLGKLDVSKTTIKWGDFSEFSMSGFLRNMINPDLLNIDISRFKATTRRLDVLEFVHENSLQIQLPKQISVTGSFKGSLNSLKLNAVAKTSQGIASIDGTLNNNESLSYDFVANAKQYQIGQLVGDSKFGELSATLKSKGTGANINQLNASLSLEIQQFHLNKYSIKGLQLNGAIKNGKGDFSSNYKDENLNVNLNTSLKLDSLVSKISLNLEVIGADLAGLGVMNQPVKTGMNLSLDFQGTPDKFIVNSQIKDGVFVYDNRTYLLGLVTAKGYVDKDTTAFSINNKLIEVALESNADPETFSKAIKRHVLRYFSRDTAGLDTITKPVILKLKGKIAQTPLLNDVFLINVKDLDTINITIDFSEKQQKLKANITAPHINYNNSELDSLSFSMLTDRDNFNFKLGFKRVQAGVFNIPETIITGNQKGNELSLNLLAVHDREKLLSVQTKITGNQDRLALTVNPDSLLLNGKRWEIPINNSIVLTENNLDFSNFKLAKKNQSIEITDKFPGIAKNHLAIDYQNFKLSEFFNYLNPNNQIIKGTLNGNFVIEQPFSDIGILANLEVSALEVFKTDFGSLKMDAKSLEGNHYNFGLKLREGALDMDVNANYSIANIEKSLDLRLVVNEFKMKALNTISMGEISEGSGSFSGNLKVNGTITDPQYSGKLKFDNATFNVKRINSKFSLVAETLQIDNDGLSMSNFRILDAKKNALVLSGMIETKSFLNPTFNLNIKAKHFNVLNANRKENENLYGKLAFDADAKLTGSFRIPKLNAQLSISPETDVTYVLPTSYTNVEERDGVVVFVNKENPNAILTKTEEQTAKIVGFDINTRLKIDKEATINIILDKETGDNFKVAGNGDFIYTMKPNGNLSLTGVYEVYKGHYELNLYNLVNRKFLLAEGSRVSWSGDPFDAKLDVRAIYKLQTSALPLMTAQISGEDPSIRNKYKQALPFDVSLNIDGELMEPKISFNLDMPKENQGAIGGQVYGRVQQVNQQEDELNRQVFSLLVLNRFFPNPGSDGSSGGFASIARDNLNDAVSAQLNAFSDKILGGSGLELDFGLNSFTDYQGVGTTDRTQLDIAAQKKLFNDRLIVRVGSEVDIQGSSANEEKTPIIGNVSLEYKITEDGSYRIRGFRKSEFENVVDGQTIVNGIALIFTREFIEYYQLWEALFRTKKEGENKSTKEK